ncbi:hypothetical protein MCOR25_008404 [Pyricularia grisea]|uniref:Uncharacterized protein n=1 Tax=Pyricularia grisea TaxID=148305 RepID=A0A6P8BIG1_PYRGI|nr:uncharacterized protein PgNI_02475 [Pyricularia grisea]KAI6354971.1 hypothetical protein MCOR25_008404 [Pyricularia grisea]TLD16407.1 hypothetical protein PgNI_02475 [Pyricularia grisea]
MLSRRLLILQQVVLLLQPELAVGNILHGLQERADGFSDLGTQLLNGAIELGQQIGLVPPGAGQARQSQAPATVAAPASLLSPVEIPSSTPELSLSPAPALAPAVVTPAVVTPFADLAPLISPFSTPSVPAAIVPPVPSVAFADFESRLASFGQSLGLLPQGATGLQNSPLAQSTPSLPLALAPQMPSTTGQVASQPTPAVPTPTSLPLPSTTPSSPLSSATATTPKLSSTAARSSLTASAFPSSISPAPAAFTIPPAAEPKPQTTSAASVIPFVPIAPTPLPQQTQPAQQTNMSQPGVSANSTLPSEQQGQGLEGSKAVARITDYTQGSFLGEVPTRDVDLPVTIIFLILFIAGAVTHMSIYQSNSRRGHKFLLSDIMFDFCVMRSLACVFRIAWIFQPVKGVIMMAIILQTGGAAVAALLNIFFAQRLLRSMHPKVGWHPAVGPITTFLAFSVPGAIIWQIVHMFVLFFSSVDDTNRANIIFKDLEAGSAFVLFLVTFPILVTSVVTGWPGPRPEPFGIGDWRVKKSVIIASGSLLTVGAAIRLSALVTPEAPGERNPVFSRASFYTTQFMLEIFVVALYAAARVDLLFFIPNGSSKPGDYSGRNQAAAAADGEKKKKKRGPLVLRDDVEAALDRLDAPYEILRNPPPLETRGLPPGRDVVWALVSVDKPEGAGKRVSTIAGARGGGNVDDPSFKSPRVVRVFADGDSTADSDDYYSPTQAGVHPAWVQLPRQQQHAAATADGGGAGVRETFPDELPQRPTRVSRRASVLEAIRPRIMRARQEEQQRAATAAMATAAAGDAGIPVPPSPAWSSSPARPSYVSFGEEEDEFYRRAVIRETIPVYFPERERNSESFMSKD